MVTGGRDDGGRENVEKEEERVEEEDETETPVDRQLQRRHYLSQVFNTCLTSCRGKVEKFVSYSTLEKYSGAPHVVAEFLRSVSG